MSTAALARAEQNKVTALECGAKEEGMTVSGMTVAELYDLIRKLAIQEKMDDSTIAQYLEIQYPGITLVELVAVIRWAVEVDEYGY